ncbi:MAG TPA: hypothetical protein PK867_29890 [Pirellulales bacterium]|nr:hypothetical protein [Pirellulales bacterium]
MLTLAEAPPRVSITAVIEADVYAQKANRVVVLNDATSRDPQGLHAAIWSEMIEYDFHLPDGKPLMAVSYSCGVTKQAFVEAVAVGDDLPLMPLFLQADRYVQVPLETTYQSAFNALPNRWREVLAHPSG